MVKAASLRRPARRNPRAKSRGQNLIELVLTLPFIIVFIFVIIDFGRAWFAYEGARMAASAGAYAAATYHSTSVGQSELDVKLQGTGLEVQTAKVSQIPNQHAYQVDVTVNFKPFFGGVEIPTLAGPIPIMPDGFPITYKAITSPGVY